MLHTHPITGHLPGALAGSSGGDGVGCARPGRTRPSCYFWSPYSPMIAYNVQTSGSRSTPPTRRATRLRPQSPDRTDPSGVFGSSIRLLADVPQTLGGAIDGREQRADYLADPFLVSMALLAGRGRSGARRATTCCSGSSPRSRSSSRSSTLRITTSWATAATSHRRCRCSTPRSGCRGRRRDCLASPGTEQACGWLGVALVGIGLALVTLWQLVPLSRYYASAARAEPTNASLVSPWPS